MVYIDQEQQGSHLDTALWNATAWNPRLNTGVVSQEVPPTATYSSKENQDQFLGAAGYHGALMGGL